MNFEKGEMVPMNGGRMRVAGGRCDFSTFGGRASRNHIHHINHRTVKMGAKSLEG